MLKVLLLVGLILTTSCVPQAPRGSRTTSTAKLTNGATPSSTPTTSTTSANTTSLYWYSGLSVPGTITINQDTTTVLYIRGTTVDKFLTVAANFSKVYCIVVKLNDPLSKKDLRARAVPISFSNLSAAGTQERLFRIDLPSLTDNQSYCDGTVGSVISADVAFTPLLSCSTCYNIIPSSAVKLYASSGAGLPLLDVNAIPKSSLDLSSLGLRINPESNSGSGEELCSNSSCGAKGFDCCLEGQCAKDGGLRPSASTNAQYSQAAADVANNPMNFINWPNVYYVCSNILRPTPGPTPIADVSATSVALFDKQKKEYLCLEEGKKTSPDFAVGYCSNSAYLTVAACTTGAATWTYYCYSAGTVANYLSIRQDVWTRCGCEAAPFPTPTTDPLEDPRCPDFGLRAIKDSQDNITQILCDNPGPKIDPTPFQNLTVTLSGRTAPHRFFKESDGTSVDDLTTLKFVTPAPVQEGTEFSYQNDAAKTTPLEVASNMNALLGSMLINLSKAQPAKVINVPVNQTFIIHTTSGIYTPCPDCAKDSWFEAFTAYPGGDKGKGLVAVGHIAKRDNYVTNVTLGNYEDTLFGRACFIPPTMIPFSHKSESTVQTQRKARLKTQYMLYANGYNRDWFGFNRGAVIGSFDGVRWFAIGTGRRVISTTTKLFLAINAPFADLADFTTMNVSVVLDQGDNIAADFDYDTSLAVNDARQNSAGSCQQYHQCETDTDCITQLGWEYMCNDITKFKTNWPKFDINADELANQSSEGVGPGTFLGELPSGSFKRCVYRGAGSTCLITPSDAAPRNGTCSDGTITNETSCLAANKIWTLTTSSDQRYDARAKMMTCAPNFYCAKLSDGAYNDEIVRTPNEIYDVFFGQDANVLGRPLKYVGASKSLDAATRANLLDNVDKAMISTLPARSVSTVGVCRPGKYIASTVGSGKTYYEQLAQKDTSKRSDIFSQIGSCNSAATTFDERVKTCPALGINSKNSKRYKNLIFYDGTIPSPSTTPVPDDGDLKLRKAQNSCGKEGTKNDTGLTSPFKNLEFDAATLDSRVDLPSLAQNACFRRAGSACFTDYDCAPNQMHASEVEFYDASYFGYSYAERNYWKEALICGQADPAPALNSAAFQTYDIKQNRCCREVNKDLTMYTEINQADLVNSQYLAVNALPTPGNYSPDTDKFPADNLSETSRYSRYSLVGSFTTTSAELANPTPAAIYTQPKVSLTTTPAIYQWKTINLTGSSNCCGGGFVRKFADGTNDWTKRDRFKFDVSNFQCLNYENDLVRLLAGPFDWSGKGDTSHDSVDDYISGTTSVAQNRADIEFSNFCQYPSPHNLGGVDNIGCLETPIDAPASGYNIVPPNGAVANFYEDVVLSMVPINLPIVDQVAPIFTANLTRRVPYPVIPFAVGVTGGGSEGGTLSSTPQPVPLLIPANNHSLEFYLPVYIEFNNILPRTSATVGGVLVEYYTNSPVAPKTATDNVGTYALEPYAGTGICPADMSAWKKDNHSFHGYYCLHSATRKFYLSTPDCGGTYNNVGTAAAACNATTWDYAGIKITYRPHGRGKDKTGFASAASNLAYKAGNTLYYLSKLGRLDLLGIPQIFYEPLYCTSHKDVLIPNLYSTAQASGTLITDRTTFESGTNSFTFSTTLTTPVTIGSNLNRLYDKTANPDPTSYGNPNSKVVFQNRINHTPIFSAHEFKCCKKLGTLVNSSSECCTGYSVASAASAGGNATTYTCMLPTGLDLHVYFNRFVSSEGVGAEEPNGGLLDTDFIPQTGEPKMEAGVYDKLAALGTQYCESGTTRLGGIIGDYNPQPNNGFYLSAVTTWLTFADSIVDGNSSQKTGAYYYNQGYRWNHHLYCAPAGD